MIEVWRDNLLNNSFNPSRILQYVGQKREEFKGTVSHKIGDMKIWEVSLGPN
jgi:hypothetical protein